jgi:UDP-glucuronate decarboxylase
MIDGFIRFMESPDDVTGPINIGNPVEFSIKELAEIVLGIVGGKSKIIYEALPSDDPKQRKPDISIAKKSLNWAPSVPLEVGILKTIDYFRKFFGL